MLFSLWAPRSGHHIGYHIYIHIGYHICESYHESYHKYAGCARLRVVHSSRRSTHSKRKLHKKPNESDSHASRHCLSRFLLRKHRNACGWDSTPADPEQVAAIDADLDLFLRSGAAGRLGNVCPASSVPRSRSCRLQLREVEDTSRTVPMSPAGSRSSGAVPKNSR